MGLITGIQLVLRCERPFPPPPFPASLLTHSRRLFHTVSIVAVLATSTCTVDSKESKERPPAPKNDPSVPIGDPSFEQSSTPDQYGHVFPEWDGYIYEGEAEFRVGHIARTGKTSCLLYGGTEPKIRIFKKHEALPPGRYRVTAYLRGLNIGRGKWNHTIEFAFGKKYMQLNKNGTFGWTKLTYVGEVKDTAPIHAPSFGLMAPGYLFIDDVEMVRVNALTPLTQTPMLGEEEAQITCVAPSAAFDRCTECGYKNPKNTERCCACGALLHENKTRPRTVVKRLNAFENIPILDRVNFLDGQSLETDHATDGGHAIKLHRKFTVVQDAQVDWSGYDYLTADLFVPGDETLPGYVEIRDDKTDGYWTRVNYGTVYPPGKSTLRIPLDQLYVGEKSRPGRKLNLKNVTKLVIGLGQDVEGPVYLDNVRLEQDTETPKYLFDGLFAFDFGKKTSPLMPGFTRIDSSRQYRPGVGYGLKDARIWREYDALQPEPLYQDFLCIEKGGLAIDLPNGKYQVFVNMDNPSGYWGEYQVYKSRKLLIEGETAAEDRMTLASFKEKYFRYWQTEDLPNEGTFAKYQDGYFREHLVTVEVNDGQLNIEFEGKNFACSVSAVVVFPLARKAQGEQFLAFVKKRRNALFDEAFRRIPHQATGDPVAANAAGNALGFVPFVRDYMQDVYYNDRPTSAERADPVVSGAGFAGEDEPLTFSLYGLQTIDAVTAVPSDLKGPSTIPSSRIDIGYVSNRITRKAMDGSTYTISPRLVIPGNTASIKQQMSRRFWMTVHVPDDALPGEYKGTVMITTSQGKTAPIPMKFRVYRGRLDPVDIPVGPWGHTINLPWLSSEPETREWNRTMAKKSLEKLRTSGFTTFSGMPSLTYRGFKNGAPDIDFSEGDLQMQTARAAGFSMPVITYTAFNGLNLYYKDEAAMKAAGFREYHKFIKAIFDAVQQHAEAANWLPVYWNIGDEPIGNDVTRAMENAAAYVAAFPKGPPYFTAATSFNSGDEKDGHYRFAKVLHVADLNGHNRKSVSMLRDEGGHWAFYNNGRRWTYGIYLFKAAKEYDVKFRLSWHWNVAAGDPYYALDCREDDYAWADSSPDGELVMSVHFERDMREGIDDYRYLLTLQHLAEQKKDSKALGVVEDWMSRFELGDTDEKIDYRAFRLQVAGEIERLRN